MEKQTLRDDLIRTRASLSAEFIEDASAVILEKCLTLIAGRSVATIHIYQSRPTWNEVDTSGIIERISSSYPAIEVVYAGLEKNTPFDDRLFDIVVVPVLGFDKFCNRIGRGAGWYDQFLATQPGALKIGLAFEAGYVEAVPTEPHDVRLDFVVTEKAIYAADSHGKSA